MSKFQAVFFPDPYDIGVRDVIIEDDLDTLLDKAVEYLRQHDCGYTLSVFTGQSWRAMDRVPYCLINHRLGRFLK